MNVKPQDLAIVVGCPEESFNGATCEVLRSAPPLPPADAFDGQYWMVRFARPMKWMTGYASEGAFPDQFLRKLSGPDVKLGWLRQREVVAEASG